MSKNFFLLDHPILQHKLASLRDKNTSNLEFRNLIKEISKILTYEATRDYKMSAIKVQTPLAKASCKKMADNPIIVSIMRAGNIMVDGILSVLPLASCGHIGIYKDRYIKSTIEYYFKLPSNCAGRKVLLVDPLVATADTVIAGIERLQQYNVGEIKLLTILISQQGLKRIQELFPNIAIYTLSVEKSLNKQGYLLPGIGDAGDRIYDTV